MPGFEWDGSEGIGPRSTAPVVLLEEREVDAAPATVWTVLTRVERWAHWHRGIQFAVLRGSLEPGTVLHWRADGMRIRSVLGEVEPGKRLGWTLRTLGARGHQRWTLHALQSGGTRIRLEESWDGVAVYLLRGTLRRTLQRSRHEWLEGLATEAASLEQAP